MQTFEFRAMNTSVFMAAEGDDWASVGMQAARQLVDEYVQRFSRFLPDSELSRLNESAGEWFPVSEDLMELLTRSMEYYNETGGLFDPSILPDLKRAGYDKSIDEIRTQGAGMPPAADQTSRPAFNEIRFDFTHRSVKLPARMLVDLGGIAKGWIVYKAALLLGTYAGACAVSAGGDIFFLDHPQDGSRWRVELEDPRDPGRTLAVLHVRDGAVVTSSVAKRTWKQGGQTQHHLIDPRTGVPAATDWLSVTVVAPSITLAEVYAKALLIGGEGEALRLEAQRPEIAFITIDKQGRLSGSSNSREFFKDYINEYHDIYQ